MEKIVNLFHDICFCHLVCCFSWSNNPTLVSKSLKSSRVRSIRADIGRFSKECSVPSILILLKFSTSFLISLSSSFCGTIVWRKRKFLLLWINLSGTEIYRRRSRSWKKRCAYCWGNPTKSKYLPLRTFPDPAFHNNELSSIQFYRE